MVAVYSSVTAPDIGVGSGVAPDIGVGSGAAPDIGVFAGVASGLMIDAPGWLFDFSQHVWSVGPVLIQHPTDIFPIFLSCRFGGHYERHQSPWVPLRQVFLCKVRKSCLFVVLH